MRLVRLVGMADSKAAETLHRAVPDELEQKACAVLQLAHDRKLALATAESCTGGLLAALLTVVRVSHEPAIEHVA